MCVVYTHTYFYVYVIYMDKLTIIMSIASSVPTYKVAKKFYLLFFLFALALEFYDVRSKKVPFTHIVQE